LWVIICRLTFLSYICWWIIYQIMWNTHCNLCNPPNVLIKVIWKKVGWKVIKVPWARRKHPSTSSEAVSTTVQPSLLPAGLSLTSLMSMRAFLLLLIGSLWSSVGQSPLSFGHRKELQNWRGFSEWGLGWQGADVGPCSRGLHFSLSQWGSFTQILITLSVAQDNRILPSALKYC